MLFCCGKHFHWSRGTRKPSPPSQKQSFAFDCHLAGKIVSICLAIWATRVLGWLGCFECRLFDKWQFRVRQFDLPQFDFSMQIVLPQTMTSHRHICQAFSSFLLLHSRQEWWHKLAVEYLPSNRSLRNYLSMLTDVAVSSFDFFTKKGALLFAKVIHADFLAI